MDFRRLITLFRAYPYSQFADSRTISRGKAYYNEKRVVEIVPVEENEFSCTVEGDSGTYTVGINIDERLSHIYFDCNCPYAVDHFCKHMVAAGMEMADYFTGKVDTSLPSPASRKWSRQMDEALDQLPSPDKRKDSFQRYAAVALLDRTESYYGVFRRLHLYVIKARNWPPLRSLEDASPQAVNQLLEQSSEWIDSLSAFTPQLNPLGCMNLSFTSLEALRFSAQLEKYFYAETYLAAVLPELAQTQVPVFEVSLNESRVLERVTLLSEPADVAIALSQEGKEIVLEGMIKDQGFHATASKIEVLVSDPAWLKADGMIFPLNHSNLTPFLNSLPIRVPEAEVNSFREKYLPRLVQSTDVHGDLIHWHDVNVKPVPRLYLYDDKKHLLRAELRFAYENFEALPEKTVEENFVQVPSDSWELLRIHRQSDEEQRIYQLLTDPIYGLKRAEASWPYGTFELRAYTHPFDFLLDSVPQLAQAGFEVYGEETLKVGRINRSTPVLRVNITSNIDWFDLQASVEFGDQKISFSDVHKALKQGKRYVKLADGSVGQIPQDWLEKYKNIWNLSTETSAGLHVNDSHLALLDPLLEEAGSVQASPDFTERRERLRNFERIKACPLPQGFVGELRPYQKHGYDWLNFLHDYNFGGILADDMGLGKTVQVLALLLSLKERGGTAGPSLLVVPKSLVVNWQRESEKFTPSLRFLEYVGNTRDKEETAFNNFDVVLTTYGTMLHDVEFLRHYHFNYIILDESQSIKNPLSKSAHAARLLNADHRLAMTGTPIENNSFELWSQFAFLNPGLLGNMDYFRREFANPIEKGQGEQAVVTLRKLIYPFILRRTKQQVAPELPPRVERVLYTDMEPAQKKYYAQTRNLYREKLLGLIEEKGMKDSRFQILEGLLRLRQIAIHPALVDSSYHGSSPKFESLLEILETLQAEQHKVLVFSQFVEVLKRVCSELEIRGMKFVYLDGQTQNRQELVDQFQNDPAIPFFLISLKAGGVGLNLTAADYVIHIDPWWNPAVEMQASDRAHRIGQQKPVLIYKIIMRDSVEEKILKLQEKKRALLDTLITTDSGFFKSLTKEDVEMLFE